MKRRHRLALGLLLFLLGAALPSSASAALTSVSINANANPTPVSLTDYSGVGLTLGLDASYSGGFNPLPVHAVFHFDNDIAFDTTGLPQCNPSTIALMSTIQATAACGPARVGSGVALYNNGAFTGVVTAFNGTQSGGRDRLLLHIDINNEAAIAVAAGEFAPSSRGGDFGSQIDLLVPVTPGVALTHLATSLDNLEPVAGHHYVSARCSDLNRILNYVADFAYDDASTRSATASQACPPTGQRAKALKKCKKKHSKKARKKCRKRAKQLPV